jgi:putative ABC transport system permease protein
LQSLLQELRARKGLPVSRSVANTGNALEAVWANRTRSLLTMLAIFIGVGAVVAIFVLTQGVGQYVTDQVLSEGAATITVDAGVTRSRGVVTKGSGRSLTYADYQDILRLPHVGASTAVVSGGNGQAIYGKQNWQTRMQGVGVEFQAINSWDMAQGIWFSSADDAGAKPVAVIGDTVAQNLFGNTDPIGKNITYQKQIFRVIGVLAPKGGFRQDDVIYIPTNTARFRLSNQPQNVGQIIVQADSTNTVDNVVSSITTLLERTHHIPKGSPDDFQLTTATQLLEQAQQEVGATTALLVGIAAISLTVGGIGVMNIMIVSVTERTREIGVRMSIGARRSDIRTQFLMEALILCIVGGALGLLVGLGGGYGLVKAFGIPFVVTPTTFIMPLSVSSIVGLVFGLFPAIRASRLDPITALRRAK